MSRFGKNGADATTVGVRIARAYTKRDHIAYCGYHGWHDWFIANTDLNAGIPNFNKKLAHSFNYNDLGSLEVLFKKYKNNSKQLLKALVEALFRTQILQFIFVLLGT